MAEKSIEIGELRELIADVLDIASDEVTEDAHFIEDLGADSLLALEMAVILERTYEIKIESHEITDVQRLRDVHELLQRKLASV
ncbi:acyl carrier protein [Streptomyces palmae]|uniref:Acyl carrier protein n=1 Tax=Streptomyces palmae TaxID=1701085 RepID=A0A4Z0HJL8_9ACTN|nr:acyl carrier protein [Streptomyces palmae]TGB19339.1 acyl carrier protein [Streptomyces palmae]